MTGDLVEVFRGAIVESRHHVHAAVVDASGKLRAYIGNPELVTFFRSCAKPFQAIPLVRDGVVERFGLTLEELALCCGSHSGGPRHLAAAASILAKIGVDAESLACGVQPPMDARERTSLAEQGLEPGRTHNTCSGKHAGMLALARVHGWAVAGYERIEHPVQGRILTEIARWSELPVEAIGLGIDGCAAVTFAMPLRRMALAWANLAGAARRSEYEASCITRAMTSYPEMVAGEKRICTDLMRVTEGRLVAKFGAEGLFCVGVPGAELGITIKIEDGAFRAVSPAILAVLRQLDLISEDDLGMMASYAYPDQRNTTGEVVGQLRPNLLLHSPGE
ncbi:MAG: asparaginase [Gemmatimonadota bacterium]|jgi:L-asparaginase II|nr:asparaginase [Gemmatimonadota bacterium]